MKTEAKKYSVLLIYPDYVAQNFGADTFYDWVKACDAAHAVEKARLRCMRNCLAIDRPEDLHCLIVTEGHNASLDHRAVRHG